MEKTLKKIQTLFKIGKIFSYIVFIFCIVGITFIVIGSSIIFSGIGNIVLEHNSMTLLETIIESIGYNSKFQLFFSLIIAFLSCICEIFLSYYAYLYFKNELIENTPFTINSSKTCLKLGIISIGIFLGESFVFSIIKLIFESRFETLTFDVSLSGSNFYLGIVFILFSLVFQYGAERFQLENKE